MAPAGPGRRCESPNICMKGPNSDQKKSESGLGYERETCFVRVGDAFEHSELITLEMDFYLVSSNQKVRFGSITKKWVRIHL